MIISKKVYTDVLSSRHVSANGWASTCRGGKLIVFFMECLMFKKKKERRKLKSLPPSVFALGYCASYKLHSSAADVPTLFRRHSSWKSFTELRLMFFRRRSKGEDVPKLWSSQKRAVPDDCYTLSLLHSSQNFLSQTEKSLKCVVHKKDEDAKACGGGEKKSASRI